MRCDAPTQHPPVRPPVRPCLHRVRRTTCDDSSRSFHPRYHLYFSQLAGERQWWKQDELIFARVMAMAGSSLKLQRTLYLVLHAEAVG